MIISPLTVGTIHIIGIGGIGMSGIAEILHGMGHRVRGSDLSDSANTRRLRDQGIQIFVGNVAENVHGASVVVHSTDVKTTNPEMVEAKKLGIPIIHRAEMLAEIMRFKPTVAISGTHGKTTTTSMMASMLHDCGLDPTAIVGGIINSYGTNTRLGKGNWMVVEADESDGTFIKIPATIAMVTNIDPEHLNYYKTFAVLKKAFNQFVRQVPFYGFSVLCNDHPVVKRMLKKLTERRYITYGLKSGAMFQATNIKHDPAGMTFDIKMNWQDHKEVWKGIHLPMVGDHNVQNATGIFAAGYAMGLVPAKMIASLGQFAGVKRRFTKTGEVHGVTIIDDYGHHPAEIKAVLTAAHKVAKGKVIAVVQPHRYSRVEDLMDEFVDSFKAADYLVLAPIYSAGEEPIPGITHEILAEKTKAAGHKHVVAIDSEKELAGVLKKIMQPGDYIICLGAGSITNWAYNLPNELK